MLAAVATNMLPALEAEAKKRQQQHAGTAPGKPQGTLSPTLNQVFAETGKAAGQAAAITGAGNTNVYQAKRVKKAAPELFKRVEARRNLRRPTMGQRTSNHQKANQPLRHGVLAVPGPHIDTRTNPHKANQPLQQPLQRPIVTHRHA